jgi:hypothetical protein
MKIQTPVKLSAADKRKLKQKLAPIEKAAEAAIRWVPSITIKWPRRADDSDK